MAVLADLSAYRYTRYAFPGTVNVGWINVATDYPQRKPAKRFLDELWRICHVKFVYYRGIHCCEGCPDVRFGGVFEYGLVFIPLAR